MRSSRIRSPAARERDREGISSGFMIESRAESRSTSVYRIITFGSTDIPGRNRSSPLCPSLNRSLTGIRCTTFT